jgi:hypothetical protein
MTRELIYSEFKRVRLLVPLLLGSTLSPHYWRGEEGLAGPVVTSTPFSVDVVRQKINLFFNIR